LVASRINIGEEIGDMSEHSQGPLGNHSHEDFAQLVGLHRLPPPKAFKAVRSKRYTGSDRLGAPSSKILLQNVTVRNRINALRERAARRAELSYDGIIGEMQEEARLARLAGQHSAAMRGIELLGMELHGMFKHRSVIEHAGEFDGMSEEELRAFILSQIKEVGLVLDANAMKLIEGKAEPAKEKQTVPDQDHGPFT
jgi:hypothetical protein